MGIEKEREAFEEWAKANGYHVAKNPIGEVYLSLVCNDAWKAWQAAKAQAVPEGFVLVPREPTQELLNKMQDFFVGAFENGLTGGQSIHCAYIAMIEAQEKK